VAPTRYGPAISDDLINTLAKTRGEAPKRLTLVVAEDSGARGHELPDNGVLAIGRARDAAIRVDDPSISREHAVLHIGARLEIEDAGSANGTYVHGNQLEPGRRVELHPGDFFEVGDVVCALRGGAARGRVRQLRPHGYFEARLQDEVERARRSGAEIGVIRVSVQSDDDTVIDELLSKVSPGDVVAQYAPCEYELLLVDANPERVASAARAVAATLTALTGVACFPTDASSADDLFAAACDAIRPDDEVAPAHTELVVLDQAMRDLHALLPRVGRGAVNVMLTGETGVGKEIIAEQVHAASPRADKPLLRLNCAAFTDTLLEGELFGYEKGAFTGAAKRKVGLLESASGGTVFLDEVGELEIGIQAKLLRVIETGILRRLGGTDEIKIDVVYVAATNRDLHHEIKAKRFRSDLYFRLNGFAIAIPPLRERISEIVPLAERFARAAAERMGEARPPTLSERARAALIAYQWPGNIRELRNTVERAVLLSAGGSIGPEHLALDAMNASPADAPAQAPAPQAGQVPAGLTPDQVDERQRIVTALGETRGNQTRAAKQLGISRRWLSTKMARYGIPRARE
jgi:DNA-binding NtrC family response regulator